MKQLFYNTASGNTGTPSSMGDIECVTFVQRCVTVVIWASRWPLGNSEIITALYMYGKKRFLLQFKTTSEFSIKKIPIWTPLLVYLPPMWFLERFRAIFQWVLGPRGVLRISSDGDDRRIFWGVWNFRFRYFLGWKNLASIFLGGLI